MTTCLRPFAAIPHLPSFVGRPLPKGEASLFVGGASRQPKGEGDWFCATARIDGDPRQYPILKNSQLKKRLARVGFSPVRT